MRRGWLLLLCATLLVWRPLDFAIELPSTLSSLGRRGVAGGDRAALPRCGGGPGGGGGSSALEREAVRAVAGSRRRSRGSAVATVQSFYWSVLPHQTMPGDKLPLSLLASSSPGAGSCICAGRGRCERSGLLRHEHDLTDHLARLEQPMRLGRLAERQRAIDEGRDLPGRQQRPDPGLEISGDRTLLGDASRPAVSIR